MASRWISGGPSSGRRLGVGARARRLLPAQREPARSARTAATPAGPPRGAARPSLAGLRANSQTSRRQAVGGKQWIPSALRIFSARCLMPTHTYSTWNARRWRHAEELAARGAFAFAGRHRGRTASPGSRSRRVGPPTRRCLLQADRDVAGMCGRCAAADEDVAHAAPRLEALGDELGEDPAIARHRGLRRRLPGPRPGDRPGSASRPARSARTRRSPMRRAESGGSRGRGHAERQAVLDHAVPVVKERDRLDPDQPGALDLLGLADGRGLLGGQASMPASPRVTIR